MFFVFKLKAKSCYRVGYLFSPYNGICVTRDVVYMDQSEDCDRVLTQTQDLMEGDLFLVKSDVYGGKETSQRQPAECSVAFNFGGRHLAVAVVDWTCEQPYREPMLAIYADCNRQRRSKPLVSPTSVCAMFLHFCDVLLHIPTATRRRYVFSRSYSRTRYDRLLAMYCRLTRLSACLSVCLSVYPSAGPSVTL